MKFHKEVVISICSSKLYRHQSWPSISGPSFGFTHEVTTASSVFFFLFRSSSFTHIFLSEKSLETAFFQLCISGEELLDIWYKCYVTLIIWLSVHDAMLILSPVLPLFQTIFYSLDSFKPSIQSVIEYCHFLLWTVFQNSFACHWHHQHTNLNEWLVQGSTVNFFSNETLALPISFMYLCQSSVLEPIFLVLFPN